MKTPLILTLLLFLSVNELQAQLIFEKDEYRSRREKLMDKIPDGIAIIRGASESLAGLPFTQYNNMMYFAGVEIPDAILIVDGEKRESTVFFTIDEHHADGENISLDLVREPVKITGIEHYRPYLDFMQCAKDVSGMNLDWFFEQFLFKPGHAVFEVAKHWDEATKTLSLEIKQTQDKWEDVPIYRIPVQLGFYHPDGKSVEKVWLKESVEKFEFKFDKAPLLVRFDEGNYLLKELIYPQSEDELLFQVENDDMTGRLWAIDQLKVFHDSPKTIQKWTELAKQDEFWAVREAAVQCLSEFNRSSSKAVFLEAGSDRNSKVRAASINALGKMKDPAMLDNFRRIYEADESYLVKAQALIAIGENGNQSQLRFLTKASKVRSPRNTLKIAAEQAMVLIRNPNP